MTNSISRIMPWAFAFCLMASIAPAATLSTFNVRANFEAATTITSTDDFEDLGIGPTDVIALPNPLTRGDFTYSTTAGNLLVGLGSATTGLPSAALAPDLFNDPLTIGFAGGIFAFGFDYSSLFSSGTLSISVFDAANTLFDTFSVGTGPTQAFFGITSDMALGSILLNDGSNPGPIVDNLAAGTVSVVPLPATGLLLLGGLCGLGAVARRRRNSQSS